jgi:hypothetical protein
MTVLVPQPAAVAEDPQALIEEARRRARRRRRRRGALAAAVIVVGVVAGLLAGRSVGGRGVVLASTSTPFANLRAFAGQGELAFGREEGYGRWMASAARCGGCRARRGGRRTRLSCRTTGAGSPT